MPATALEDALANRFELERPRLRAVAARVLGSEADADDVVQDAWLRLRRTDPASIDNLPAWLTTVVGRLSLNVLRSRGRHPADPLPDAAVDDLPAAGPDPEAEALAADAVALALSVVLDTLAPAERVAFVLHDVFDLPFEAIADLLDRSVGSARQLASRGRRRVRVAAERTPLAPDRRQDVVAAFFAAGRQGDLQGLLAALHPDVELRINGSATDLPVRVRTAAVVAARARSFADPHRLVSPLTVAGLPAALITRAGRRLSLMVFDVVDSRIETIDVLTDEDALQRLHLPAATA